MIKFGSGSTAPIEQDALGRLLATRPENSEALIVNTSTKNFISMAFQVSGAFLCVKNVRKPPERHLHRSAAGCYGRSLS